MPAQVQCELTEKADQDFFAVFIAATGLICGIGHTKEAAWAIAEAIEEPDEEGIYYDIKPCSREVVRRVMAEGGDIPYDDRHGTLVTEQEARKLAAALRPVP